MRLISSASFQKNLSEDEKILEAAITVIMMIIIIMRSMMINVGPVDFGWYEIIRLLSSHHERLDQESFYFCLVLCCRPLLVPKRLWGEISC